MLADSTLFAHMRVKRTCSTTLCQLGACLPPPTVSLPSSSEVKGVNGNAIYNLRGPFDGFSDTIRHVEIIAY